MTWISVNPKVEPFTRKSAALALSGTEAKAIDNLTPQELANLYNNVEALGIDLYSLKLKPSDNGEETL